jgi:DNA polymerase-1
VIKSTSKAVLHELQAFDREYGRVEEPFLRDVLEYRSLVHTKATYLIGLGHDVFDRVTVYSDGYRVRTHLLMHGTATGRLASRDPNLQNIPKDSPIREMFVPTDGYTFIEADYAQLEVRVLAWISEDRELAATVREKDVHWATASRVWPALTRNMLAALGSDDELSELEELCHTNSMFLDFYLRQRGPNRTNKASELYDWMKTRIRRQAKYVTFGIMYGEGAEALSLGEKGLGVPVKEAQSYIDNWRATYRQAWAWLQQQAAFAKYERWVESPNGRRRRFGYPDELSHVANEAMNFPIQSFASDINLAALVKLNHRLRSERCGFVLLPVHDSQLFEVPTDQLATGEDYIRSAMTTVIRDDQVTFDVDLKRGSSWADLH